MATNLVNEAADTHQCDHLRSERAALVGPFTFTKGMVCYVMMLCLGGFRSMREGCCIDAYGLVLHPGDGVCKLALGHIVSRSKWQRGEHVEVTAR